jgi:hypothetical protein
MAELLVEVHFSDRVEQAWVISTGTPGTPGVMMARGSFKPFSK